MSTEIMPYPSNTDDTKPRWHRLYYVLAAFDIVAVCVSIYLNQQIVDKFTIAVGRNRAWAGIAKLASELEEYSAYLVDPGNDVFESTDVELQRTRSQQADAEVTESLFELHALLAEQPQGPEVFPLLEDVRTTRGLTREAGRDVALVLAYFEADKLPRAREFLVTLNRRAATIRSVLTRMRGRIDALQRDHLLEQSQAAGELQRSEVLVAGLIVPMVLAAVFYGRELAKQTAVVARGKENYRQELESRVAERTASLTIANDARADLLKQLLSAQEDERRRIARDLHDGIGQSLTYLIQRLRGRDAENGGKLAEFAEDTLHEVRRLARGLRPTILDDLGLAPAIERLADEFRSAQDIELEVLIEDIRQIRLDESQETTVFRVIQEALANIVKYAKASHVRIQVKKLAAGIETTIADNGQGLPSEGASPEKPSMGLSSIRERAMILGGHAEIASGPGQGTTVRMVLPLTSTAKEA